MNSEQLPGLLKTHRKSLSLRGSSEGTLDDWSSISGEFVLNDDVELLRAMLDDSPYFWREVIGSILTGLFSDDRALQLCLDIDEKGHGLLWNEIRKAARNNHELAKRLLHKIITLGSASTVGVASAVMAGISEANSTWGLERIIEGIRNSNTMLQLASFRASCYAISVDITCPELEELILTFEKSSTHEVEEGHISSLLALHRTRALEVENKFLKSLGSFGVPELALSLRHPAIQKDFSLESRKQIANHVLGLDEPDLSESCGFLLIGISQQDLPFVLEALRVKATRGLLFMAFGRMDDYLLSESGKNDYEFAFRTVDEWIDNHDNDNLRFQIPDILEGLSKGNIELLLHYVSSWYERDSVRAKFWMLIMKDLISERIERKNDPILRIASNKVIEVARGMDLDTTSICEGERDEAYQALMILDSLLNPVGEVDYEQLLINLESTPEVRDFLGLDWLKRMQAGKVRNHLLLIMFSRKITEKGDSYDRWLQYWDDVFSRLDPDEPGVGNLRRKLRKYPRVQDTLSEAEVASLLKKQFKVEVEPEIPGLTSGPDLRVHLTDQCPVLEVYTPQPERKLLYAGGGFMDANRLKKKILEKHKSQFKGGSTSLADPVVIVIHDHGSAFVGTDVRDLFHGTITLRMKFDKATGRCVETGCFRDSDTLFDEDPTTSVISGILVYQRDFDPLSTLVVRYYPNPTAELPLSDRSVFELCSCLSPGWTPTATNRPGLG